MANNAINTRYNIIKVVSGMQLSYTIKDWYYYGHHDIYNYGENSAINSFYHSNTDISSQI